MTPTGLEPVTRTLKVCCSTTWATESFHIFQILQWCRLTLDLHLSRKVWVNDYSFYSPPMFRTICLIKETPDYLTPTIPFNTRARRGNFILGSTLCHIMSHTAPVSTSSDVKQDYFISMNFWQYKYNNFFSNFQIILTKNHIFFWKVWLSVWWYAFSGGTLQHTPRGSWFSQIGFPVWYVI